MARTVWLIGMMGSGKSSVGEQLADRLGVTFYDTDTEIVGQLGCSIAEIWSIDGEDAFRDLEERQVARLAGREAVVSTGGGIVLRPSNVALMRTSGPVVWLHASVDRLIERVGAGEGRPLLSVGSLEDRLTGVLAERMDLYRDAASVIIETDALSVEDVVLEVERCIGS